MLAKALSSSPMRRVLAAMLALVLAACGSGSSAPAAGDVVRVAEATLPSVAAAAIKQIMTYRMPGVTGSLVEATAVVLIPPGTPPDGGWPVIGWGHGTTGVADACAPSATTNLSGYDTYLDALLAAGNAIVAPDYEGLGSPGRHPYLHLDSEGRSLLHAIKAATMQYSQLGSRYALLGHSQGGHAVVGAAELANAGEVSGLSLVGVVALAPSSQVDAQGDFLAQVANNPAALLQDRVEAGAGRLAFLSLILAGVEAVDPSFDDAGSYGQDGGFIPDLVAGQCFNTIFADLVGPVQTVLGVNNNIESLLPSSVADEPAVAAYLDNLEPGFRVIVPPVLLIQGDLDTTVFPSSTQQLLNNMANQGNLVSLETFENETHSSILAGSLMRTIEFFADQFMNSAL